MSDQGFGAYTAPGGNADDLIVNLNIGVDTTGGLAGQKPPEGQHVFEVKELRIEFTKQGEQAVVCNMVCVGSSLGAEALGTSKEEWLTIPGDTRKETDLATWQKMMRMFRLRLEAITGKQWRMDNLQLKRSDLLNRRFIATVTHTKTKSDDGEKEYVNANLNDYQAIAQQPNGQQQFGGQQAPPQPEQLPQHAPQPAQQSQPQQQVPPADGPGFGNFGGFGQQPPAQQAPPSNPNTAYNPEEPF